MARGKGDIKGWITKNGIHIPIYSHYSVRGGEEPKAKGSKFKRKKRPEEFDKDIRETEGGKFMAQYSSDQGRKKGVKDIEKPFETREGARKFLAEENGEYEDAYPKNKSTKIKRGMTNEELDTANRELDAKDAEADMEKYEAEHPMKKGKKDKYADRDWNKDVDDAKRYGYSEQTEEGKKPVTKVEESRKSKRAEATEYQKSGQLGEDLQASNKALDEKWQEHSKQESSKTTPESYAQSKGKSIRDIAQEVNKNDAARAQANQLMKDGRTYEEAAALAHSDMERGVLKGQESSTPDFSKMSYSEAGKYVSEHKKDFGLKAGDDAYQAAYEMKQGTWKQPQTATKQNKNSVSTTESYPWIKSFGSNEPSASEYGKAMDSINQRYDRETKTVPGREMGKVFEGLKPGDQIKVHNRWSTSPDTYTVNADGTIDYYTPSSSFLGKSGMSLAEAQKHAINDVDNRITVMRKKSQESSTSKSKQDSLSASMNERSRIRGEFHAKDKAMKAAMPTTVSGLRSAYADATGSMKSKIAAELRRKGYSLVGGKWVKGRKE